jgi:ABC-type oligopeptide transport system substrate-binding subunit
MKRQVCGSALLILLVLCLVVAGCASQEEQTSTRVRVGVGNEPSTLDPSLLQDSRSCAIISELAPPLTALDPQTGEVKPRLAEEWQVSPDGLVWTFRLRDDVTWVQYDPESGEAAKRRQVTAHDVVYGTRRTIDPTTGSSFAFAL